MAYNRLSLADKLRTKSQPQGDCVIWTGWKDARGYAMLKLDRKNQRAARVTYALHHGPIAPGLVIRHTCDNPACVNIAHLVPGTQAQNIADMHQRGRAVVLTGERNPNAKLTAEQVATIRARYVRHHRVHGGGALAREFGISYTHLKAIMRGASWAKEGNAL